MPSNLSPKTMTTTTEENISVVSQKSDISFPYSVSSITLDSCFDSDASIETEKTGSPLFFDHDDIEGNFITICQKSNRDVNRLLSSQPKISFYSDEACIDHNVITISEKSRNISLHSLFTENKKPYIGEIKFDVMQDFLNQIPDVSDIKPSANETFIETSPRSQSKLKMIHKLIYGMSFASIATGTILLIMKTGKTDQNNELTFPGVFLILMGCLGAVSTTCSFYMNRKNDLVLNEDFSIHHYC